MEAKKIIITGGATRIGAAIAKSLAGLGVQLVIHYYKSSKQAKNLKKELEDLGTKVFLIKANLEKYNNLKKIVSFASKKMKGLDCLINNASIFENDDLNNFTDKSFNKHININLKAPATLIQQFKKYVKNNQGTVINIIDQRVEKLTPFFFSYTTSKVGLSSLTKTAAMKYAPNIRINAISPGPTLKNNRQTQSHFKKQWQSVLLKKKVEIKNICEGVNFLIKNDNITGEIINIDSGQRLAWKTPDIINSKE